MWLYGDTGDLFSALMGSSEEQISHVQKLWNAPAKCQHGVTPTRNAASKCLETRPLVECLLGICFAFAISTQAGIKLGPDL